MQRRSFNDLVWLRSSACALFLLTGVLACSSGDDDSTGANGDGDGGTDPFGNPNGRPTDFRDGGGSGSNGGSGSSGAGGSGTADGGFGCGDALRLVVRDFTEEHPDFEHFTGDGLDGIVEEDLGSDHKPVYASDEGTALTSGPDEFADWYHDVDGVNQRVEVDIRFTEVSPGVFAYDNSSFFPIDGQGFGNGPDDADHNFLFTTEAHTVFTYKGGEQFTFRGDDDLWVFVNNKLAVDLGGLHSRLEESIDFDANADRLGITVGETYPMDIFHAERHTEESNFRIETTIDLTCIDNISVD